jgi:hypothetical protein
VGYRYYAISIIGCAVAADKIVPVAETECGCELHRVPPRFCPNCGKPYKIVYKVAVEGLDGDKFRGLDVASGLDHTPDTYYVGVRCVYLNGGDEDATKITAAEVLDAIRTVRDVLEPCGLWDPDSFGAWTILSGA